MQPCAVAPFAGAWIEIESPNPEVVGSGVAPFTGAWIEIDFSLSKSDLTAVAPFTGAWIEILLCCLKRANLLAGRTLCGCVD